MTVKRCLFIPIITLVTNPIFNMDAMAATFCNAIVVHLLFVLGLSKHVKLFYILNSTLVSAISFISDLYCHPFLFDIPYA